MIKITNQIIKYEYHIVELESQYKILQFSYFQMSMNVLWVHHVILTPLATTQLDRSLANVITDTKEMEPTVEVSI